MQSRPMLEKFKQSIKNLDAELIGYLVLGTILAWPFLLRADRPELVARRIGSLANVVGLFVCLLVLSLNFLLWLRIATGWPHSLTWARALVALLLAAAAVATVATRHFRRRVIRYAGDVFGSRAARRTVLAGGIASVGLVALGYDPVRRFSHEGRGVVRGSRTNVLLVTFDACAADDTSLGGNPARPTPHLERFAERSITFPQALSASTFTTSSVASLLTGRFPSEHKVYDHGARFHGEALDLTLPRLLRRNGYFTAASVANPHAHPGQALGIAQDFDCLPPPALHSMPLTFPERELTALRGVGDVPELLGDVADQVFISTFTDLRDAVTGLVRPRPSDFPPELSFQQGLRLLAGCRDAGRPFFLWIHVFAPHDPYLPAPPFLNRYLDDGRRAHDPLDLAILPDLRFAARHQNEVGRMRRRYWEWMAQADAAFADFLAKAGPMDDTAVIVSADHGESFDGTLRHASPHHMRGEIHIPLMLRPPGTNGGRRIDGMVSQTAIAPTILETCGLDRPAWMRTPPLLSTQRPEFALGQFFVGSSPFRKITKGTLSAVDGIHQYVFDLAEKRGRLRRWNAVGEIDADRTAEAPEAARKLHAALAARFPDLFG